MLEAELIIEFERIHGEMKYQVLLMFLTSGLVLLFNQLVYFKNRKSKVNQSFSIFGIFIFIWLFCFSIAYVSVNSDNKLFWFKMGYLGIIFIPISFYSFIFHLMNRNNDWLVVKINYLIGLSFIFLHLTNAPLVIGLYKFPWGYYPNTSTPIHIVFFIFFLLLFISSNTLTIPAFWTISRISFLCSEPSHSKTSWMRV